MSASGTDVYNRAFTNSVEAADAIKYVPSYCWPVQFINELLDSFDYFAGILASMLDPDGVYTLLVRWCSSSQILKVELRKEITATVCMYFTAHVFRPLSGFVDQCGVGWPNVAHQPPTGCDAQPPRPEER